MGEQRFAPVEDQIVTRKSLLSETVQTGELATLFAEAFTNDLVREIAEAIVGVPGAVLADIDARIESMLGGIASTADELRELIEGVLGVGATVDQVVAFILSLGGGLAKLGRIPASLIISGSPNLLDNGAFEGSVSLEGEGAWSWDGDVGRSAAGSARTSADGTRRVLTSNAVECESGESFDVEGWVKWSGVAASGAAFEVAVCAFDVSGAQVSRTVIGAVSSPVSSGGWSKLAASYTVASGVVSLRVQIVVNATVSAGSVWFDDLSVRRVGGIRQALVDGLGSALAGLNSLTSSLQATLNQFGEIFDGFVVTPINSVVGAVKDWFNQWFGGGSSNAIPLSQKGANNGVCPLNGSGKVNTALLVTDSAGNVPTLDSSGKLRASQVPNLSDYYIGAGARGASGGVAPLNSDAVVPLTNLPGEVGGTGGSGAGLPFINLRGTTDLSVPNNTPVTISGLSQQGTASVEWSGQSNSRFRLPRSGLWWLSGKLVWDSNRTGNRTVEIYRSNGRIVARSPISASSMASDYAYHSFGVILRVYNYTYDEAVYSASDSFWLVVSQSSGSTRNTYFANVGSDDAGAFTLTFLGAA
ncbi:minor tail protein [Gordonia phage Gsput1]|uniref:Galactose binding protein n=1 Tax=Gordonia phage Gsput1 TaxID=1622193 RepID=A0A0E3T899_9CAUD|nr:minor tail protein [Gordonia phage Gsput1]AKC03050.1 galactose binding protein [Gordonia phage Gsput1]